ncbi:uncharacterized protein EI90DRAFT_3016296 [Cantharellus anzutake]|uniref:uncharacterized protein n=1 Tax=Cantharellus anzutake TaxID=1750568 RepID=UPI0019043846|nr:uncharacterized protein EI90DRAFT_3016296 [Cantharellus anzutake]KAF8331758.1 hypothetical protein EI90DRAFT_3016296 [Cantharellus anzutake]
MRADMRHFTPEYNEGSGSPPKKDPDKALRCESDSNRGGETPKHVRTPSTASESNDGYVEPPTKDPDKDANTIEYSGNGLVRRHESKVTPEAKYIRDAKLHSGTLEMPEGTYVICDDEIALFEVNGESEPSRKSNIARVLDSAKRTVSVLETPEGIYVIHGGLVILFEVAQAAEREIQFRPSLAQDGTEFKAKSEPKSLSLSDELSSMPISVTLTRELNREQDYDLIDKDANIHDVFDAMNGPTSRNLVSAGPGNGAPQPPKTPRSPDLVDDGYECRPEKDPDKVSNMNKRPGNGPAREQESEETPEVKCLRGVESQGDTHILAMPEGIFSFQA